MTRAPESPAEIAATLRPLAERATTTYHVHLDVRGAMRWPKRRLARLLIHEDGRYLTADEAWSALADCLASGVEALPIGECDNFDPKTGCRGHRAAPTPEPTDAR